MKWIVKVTVENWKWVEADSREEAIQESYATRSDYARTIKVVAVKDKHLEGGN